MRENTKTKEKSKGINKGQYICSVYAVPAVAKPGLLIP